MNAQPVQKTIGGVTFEDRFPHLQEDTAEALAWQWDRDAKARAAAEASPNYEPVRRRLLSLPGLASSLGFRKRGGLWFGYVDIDGDTVLRVGETINGEGRSLVSTRALSDAAGAQVMLAWFEASPNGRFVAVGVAAGGKMVGAWSVYETAPARHVLDAPAVLHNGSRPGWLQDDGGFWLDGRNDQGLHELRFVPVGEGATERTSVVISETLVGAEHSGLTPHVSPDGKRAVLVTEPHEHRALVLLDLETLAATPFLPEGYSGECDGTWRDAGTYVARATGADAPRGRVVAIPAATSRDMATWRELVPESEGFMGWAGIAGGKIYVGDLVDVSLRVRVFDVDGGLIGTLPLDSPGSSPSMNTARALRPTEALAFTHTTFTRSATLFVHDPATDQVEEVVPPAVRLEGVTAEQRFAVSRDGTRVPYFVVRRTDLPAGPNPALVHAYGGFNVSKLPDFPTDYVPFIEAGGVFVQACLRGGAEYGRAWHDGGRLKRKQNTFDDLEAVAKALIADGVSTPDRMAFMGASNGGLLAGVAIVQQPHLWRVVAPVVPVFDMMEFLPITPATASVRAIFYEDYGDPANPEDAEGILRWSPYHNIQDGVAYPAVYQVFGEHDAGCMPFHGRKFTARLGEADTGGRPIHLRVWRDTGHGVIDPVKHAAYVAEWLAFVMDQLGLQAIARTGDSS
jgi:prolyl oligopeptidase